MRSVAAPSLLDSIASGDVRMFLSTGSLALQLIPLGGTGSGGAILCSGFPSAAGFEGDSLRLEDIVRIPRRSVCDPPPLTALERQHDRVNKDWGILYRLSGRDDAE